MDWMIPCQKAATLLVAREDRPLALGERGALRFHLLICKACTRFEHQMLTMRQAMDGWRNYTEQSLDGGDAETDTGQATTGTPPQADSPSPAGTARKEEQKSELPAHF
jgi:hypothetical protein